MITETASILLAGQNSGLIPDLTALLAATGYRVTLTPTGQAALDQALLRQPDLILLEVTPSLAESCQGLKEAPQTREIPIILIAAPDQPFDRAQGLALGAVDYAIFPTDQQALLARIQTQLKLGRLQRELAQARGRKDDGAQAAETEVQESETTFRQIAENTRQVFWVTPPEKDRMLYISPAYETIWGRSCESLYASPTDWLAAVLPEDREKVHHAALTNQTLGKYDVEYRIKHTDGSIRWIWDRAFPIRNEAGEIYRIVGIADDITEDKLAEEALRRSQQRYKDLVNTIDGIVWTAEPRTLRFTFVSRQAERLLGYPVARWLNEPSFWLDQLHPADRAQALAHCLEATNSKESRKFEYRMRAADGRMVWLRDMVTVIVQDDRVVELWGVMVDITERKQAEEALQRRNHELTLLNRIMTASATEAEPEAVLEIACRELALAFGLRRASVSVLNEQETEATVIAEYTQGKMSPLLNQTIVVQELPMLQEILKRPGPMLVENVASDRRLGSFAALISQQKVTSILVVPLLLEDTPIGTLNLGSAQLRPYSPEELELAGNIASQIASLLARVRLAQLHHRLLTAIEQSPESVMITDSSGDIVYVNPAFEEVSGYSRSEVIGQNPRILKSHRQDSSFYHQLWVTLAAGEIWRGRFINQKKDGSLFTEEAIITPVRDRRGTVVNYVALKRDVTRELQLEEQYRQSQKMEGIGRLAGGVAHDFNNLLTAMMGYTGMALQSLHPDDPIRPDIEGIQRAAERAAALTRQLLAFARKQIIHPVALNLNDLIFHLSKMLRRLIGEDIELIILSEAELAQIKADPSQMEQVVLNLVLNARDAMPEGGKLILSTSTILLEVAEVRPYAEVAPGKYVRLTIRDTGIGMSEEIKEHIFEPFFTTKEEGKGTGLGLATVFGIIKQNEGHIWCDSQPGQGSSFTIYLPALERAENSPVDLDKRSHLPRGTETILLVEDEATVRNLIARMLRDRGYRLLEAANASEALALAQEHEEAIDLLLTDVVMPGLSGKVLAERLRSFQPQVKVLFISGYTDDVIIHHGVLEQATYLLQKPFKPEELIRQVRQVLDTSYSPDVPVTDATAKKD